MGGEEEANQRKNTNLNPNFTHPQFLPWKRHMGADTLIRKVEAAGKQAKDISADKELGAFLAQTRGF